MDHLLHRVSFKAMGGPCEIDLAGVENPENLIELAVAEVKRIEQKYSRYVADSLIGRINAQAGLDWVICDPETSSLFDYANHLHEISHGLFDITSGVLRQVWDFNKKQVPAPERLKKVLPLIGWTKVERRGHAIRLKHAGMQIDLGGFGKEYAVDRVASLFLEQGVTSALINFGGDVRALGTKPGGHPWQIGVQDPRRLEHCFATLALSQGALTTSGDYERYFDLDGRRYCHILDPKTGMPVSFWRSVTVLAPMASVAGATSTIAMLLQKNGLKFLKNSGFSYIAINHAGEVSRNSV